MTALDPQLERLIVRHLDGELSAEEQAELYRQVLRDPRARQAMEQYQADDQLMRDALCALLDGRVGSVSGLPGAMDESVLPAQRGPRSRLRWVAVAGGGALAAMIAVVVMLTMLPSTPSPSLAQGHGNESAEKTALPTRPGPIDPSATPLALLAVSPTEPMNIEPAESRVSPESPESPEPPESPESVSPAYIRAYYDEQSQEIYLLEVHPPAAAEAKIIKSDL